MRARENLGSAVAAKVLSDNARKLYGLPQRGVDG